MDKHTDIIDKQEQCLEGTPDGLIPQANDEIAIRNRQSSDEDESWNQTTTIPIQPYPDEKSSFNSLSEINTNTNATTANYNQQGDHNLQSVINYMHQRNLPTKKAIIDENEKKSIWVDLDNKKNVFSEDLGYTELSKTSGTHFHVVCNEDTSKTSRKRLEYFNKLKERGLACLKITSGCKPNEADLVIVRGMAERYVISSKQNGFFLVSEDESFDILHKLLCGRSFSILKSKDEVKQALKNNPPAPITQEELPCMKDIITYTNSHHVVNIFFLHHNLRKVPPMVQDRYKRLFSDPNSIFITFTPPIRKKNRGRLWYNKCINSERLYEYPTPPENKKDTPLFALIFYLTLLHYELDSKIKFTIYSVAKDDIVLEEIAPSGRDVFLDRPPKIE